MVFYYTVAKESATLTASAFPESPSTSGSSALRNLSIMSRAWLTGLKPLTTRGYGRYPYSGRQDKIAKEEISLLWQEEAKGAL